MRAEHRFEIKSLCPVDRKPDVYQCVVRSSRIIPVEDILAAASGLSSREIFQEELTRELHRVLAAQVETVGWHSGVTTRVVVGDAT